MIWLPTCLGMVLQCKALFQVIKRLVVCNDGKLLGRKMLWCLMLDSSFSFSLAGISNVGVLENSLPSSDRRKGRKGRRHKVSIKPVDGNQPSPSDKDNVTFDNQLNEQVRYHDNLLVDSGECIYFILKSTISFIVINKGDCE